MINRVLGLVLFAIGIGMLMVFLLPGNGFVMVTSILCIFLGYIFFKNY